MQDNSTYDIIETLTRYVDDEMDEAEKAATTSMINNDAEVKERYENLLAAKRAIRSKGLKERVHAIHLAYANEIAQPEVAKIVKPSFGIKMMMRIAAVLILVVAGMGVYTYSTTNNENVFEENFTGYQLPVNRGAGQFTNIDSLYAGGAYEAVIDAVNKTQIKTRQAYFLAAQAYLLTGNPAGAITAFKNVEQLNSSATDQYFVQETDYYLALAYIKMNDITNAEKQLAKISSNPKHLFYSKAKSISNTTLTILKWKQ
ncbi:hypothetical protein I5907_03695 [Panacibacter sp. DH6]|uniref:Tetratricopeptide repeat protein n=1 Tax=Panacibacter microcysteis TaxID=2793269 RepID=A0A931E4D5_9BACT|nr:tetratricopeptide repeat protein [Panacibacter microcysteis]MBG9375321.1 hypothetical protein [Panacibacter microcysteis]